MAIPLLAIAGVVQVFTWVMGDKAFENSGTTMATATGPWKHRQRACL